ncbi:site-specific integrase [Streptomyces sp. ISL-44]|uniref:tyrosine-type recombinase/integrase n=1 Tax=Streptomyces sp. ISL-44 TaxID=2819184 RepID=UPI001BE5791C|nr:site-specific integrase [Streptomyces sp. ISL-44]MBT2541962.1 site-specific integrase [Streptomyces sp. ISL-44]
MDLEDFFYAPGGLSDTCGRATLGRYRNETKQFLAFCHRRGWTALSADTLVEGIRERSTHTNRNRYRMTRAEIRHLVEAAEDPRDRALIMFVACTGVRISEALGMRVRDVSFPKGELYVTVPKCSEEVVYPLSSDLEGELRLWLTAYAGQVGELKRTYRLFPTYFRREFVAKGIQAPAGQYNPVGVITTPNCVLRPIADRAEIELEEGDGWHTVRRSFARILYDDAVHMGHDAALRVVQAALNHKSVKTTEGYLGLTTEHKQFRHMLKGKPFLTADLDPGKIVDLGERRAAGRG